MSRVLILGASSDVTARVRALPGHEVWAIDAPTAAAEGFELEPVFARDCPDLVLLGEELEPARALLLAQVADGLAPHTSLALVGTPDTELLLDAMRAGVRDVVDPTAPDTELQVLLHRAAQHVRTAPATYVPERTEADDVPSRVITVVSPKGGVGKTTVATNLAIGLAKTAPMDTILVDLDLAFGDVATMLDLSPTHSLVDAVGSSAATDMLIVKTFLTVHPSGFYVLCAPDSPAAGDRISGQQVRDLVARLAQHYRYVVVDTAGGLTEHTLSTLEVTTDVVMLATMDVACVRGVRKEIDLLVELDLLPASRHVVLNLADRHSGLDVGDVETVVGLPVDVVLPRAREVALSTNRGVPLLLARRGGPVAKGVQTLVDRFLPASTVRARRQTRRRLGAA